MHDANRHKALLSTRHPCGDIEMLKLQLVYTSFPLFCSLKPPFSQTMGTMWSSSVSGPGRQGEQSAGALWFALEWIFTSVGSIVLTKKAMTHTQLPDVIKMLNTVHDDNENIFSTFNLQSFCRCFNFSKEFKAILPKLVAIKYSFAQ